MSLGETVMGEAGLAVLSAWGLKPVSPSASLVLPGAYCVRLRAQQGGDVGPAGAGVSRGGPLLRPAPLAEQGLTGPQMYRIGGGVAGSSGRAGPGDTGQDWAHRVNLGGGAEADRHGAQCKLWKETLL